MEKDGRSERVTSLTQPPPPRFGILSDATLFDETLTQARTANKLVVVRFGRSDDRHCQRCDATLRQAADMPEIASVLSLYTMDVDAVPEFTYMYELYDPCTVMIFHQSKPLVVDAGHGHVRKLTELSSVDSLRALLLRVINATLDLQIETPGAGSSTSGRGSTDEPDAPASLKEEASRLAHGAQEWLGAKSESISNRVGTAMEQSGGWLQSVEERGWSVFSRASTSSLAAIESARQHLQKATGSAPPSPAPKPPAPKSPAAWPVAAAGATRGDVGGQPTEPEEPPIVVASPGINVPATDEAPSGDRV